MIKKWFRNLWEARFLLLKGRISYPRGKQPRVRSLTTACPTCNASLLTIVFVGAFSFDFVVENLAIRHGYADGRTYGPLDGLGG